jgi:hypothetical protein
MEDGTWIWLREVLRDAAAPGARVMHGGHWEHCPQIGSIWGELEAQTRQRT